QVIIDNGGLSGTNTPLPSLPTTDVFVRNGAVIHPQSAFMNVRNLSLDPAALLTAVSTQMVDVVVFGDATVGSNSAIRVNGRGFAQTNGPGAGQALGGSGGGGGHGGSGGASAGGAAGGGTYGSAPTPTTIGSGGGAG